MSSISRVIVPGTDISRDPDVLVARGAEQMAELASLIGIWERDSDLHLMPIVSTDLMSVEFRLRMLAEPPLERWSILLGEAVHSFRSALDGLAFQLSHLDGKSPERPKQVYFPVVRNPKDWRNKSRNLTSMPEELLGRIEAVQPFVTNPNGEISALWAIHELDLLPKHRQLLRAIPRVEPEELGLQLKFAVSKVSGTLVPSTPARMENNALVLQLTFDERPAEVIASPVRDVPFNLAVEADGLFNAGALITQGANHMRAIFSFIYTGHSA
jgi:hypothetical protein